MTDSRCRVDVLYATFNRSPTQDLSRILVESYVKGSNKRVEAQAMTCAQGRFIFDRQSVNVAASKTKGEPTVVCIKIVLKGTLKHTTLGRSTLQIPETIGLGMAEELDLRDGSGTVMGKVFVQISLAYQTGTILAVRKNTPNEVMSPKTPLERAVTSETMISDTGVSLGSCHDDGAPSDHSSQSNATGRSVGSHVLVCGQLPKNSRYKQSVGQIAHQGSAMSIVSAPSVHSAQSGVVPTSMQPEATVNNNDDDGDEESYPLTAGMEPPRFGSKKKPTFNERLAKLKAQRSVPVAPQHDSEERFPACLARQINSNQY